MIGSIIAADYAKTRDPRHLRSDRLLQGGFRGRFPFADTGTVDRSVERRASSPSEGIVR